MHWVRILLGAFLLEVILIVMTIPIFLIWGTGAVVWVAPPALFIVGYLVMYWLGRKMGPHFALNGALVGIVATLIYLGLVYGQSGSLTPVIELYGPVLFILANGLRILGCILGAAAAKAHSPAVRNVSAS
jgi:hypothetical protein